MRCSYSLILLTLLSVSCGNIFGKKSGKGPGPDGNKQIVEFELESSDALTRDQMCNRFKDSLPSDKGYVQGYVYASLSGNPYSSVRADDQDAPIKVFYYGYINPDEDQVPIVFFNGGPAGSSHSSWEILFKNLVEKTKQSIILIDQRGTGCSTAFPDSSDYERVSQFWEYQYFYSKYIVRDAELVRKKLFGEDSQWKIFGQSYGSLIVHRYLEEAPESIVSAHAHGFAPGNDTVEGYEARLSNFYKVVQTFFDTYPQAKTNFEKLRSYLTPNRCYRAGDTEICGFETFDVLGTYLNYRNQWEDIAELFATGGKLFDYSGEINVENLEKLIKFINFDSSEPIDDSGSAGGMTISLMEILPENATKEDPTGCVRAFDNLINADLIDPNELYFNECAGALELTAETNEMIFNLASYLGVKDFDINVIKANLEKYAIPFYLYSGELDGMAPPSIFTKEVSVLGDLVYYKNFENSGHDGFYTESEVWDTLIK